MRILLILKIRRIHEFLRILKCQWILKIKFAKITDWVEIFDANVLTQLVMEENSIVMSAEPTLAC